mmetsp:Transcript_53201/g.154889  ORF Transcript_53201/g.154889 Transcript_53201/m.154889 type:complete len:414 (-) Transcript_53201:27-1268(-)
MRQRLTSGMDDDPAADAGSMVERELATPGAVRAAGRHGLDDRLQSRLRTRRYVKYVDKSILNYDAEGIMGILGVLLSATAYGSVFRKKAVLKAAVLTWSSALLLLLVLMLLKVEVSAVDVENFRALITDFHNICTFLLGFFISTCYARWWAIRADGIGGLWGNLDDLMMQMGALFPQDDEADREVREKVLRWGALSHELMYKQIHNDQDLTDLVDDGLLTSDEMVVLQPLSSRPQCICAWLCSYMAHLAYGDPAKGGSRMPHPVTMLPHLLTFCCKARDAIGILFTFTDSQVPFRYVHILSFIVWTHNLVQALTSAFRMAHELGQASPHYTALVAEGVFLLFYPAVYTSLLHVGAGMLNPMRSHSDVDFPRAAFTCYMLAECRSFNRGQVPPAGPQHAPGHAQRWRPGQDGAL